jgi:hypothetical protein
MKRFFVILLLTLVNFFLPIMNCSAEVPLIYYDNSLSDEYAAVLRETVTTPITLLGRTRYFLSTFTHGAYGVEAFSTQAQVLAQNKDYTWQPHYQATVVLAVREDIQDITGWQDALASKYKIAITERQPYFSYLLMGLSYGLSGRWETQSAVNYLRQLQQEERLVINNKFGSISFLNKPRQEQDTPIMIVFDYQAVQLQKLGNKYKIIIPKEGTLTLTKGILTKGPLAIDNNKLAESLAKHGFRPVPSLQKFLPSQMNSAYPRERYYQIATGVPDQEDFTNLADNLGAQVRRQVFGVRYFATADGFEHYLSYFLLLAFTVFIFAAIMQNVLQPGVKKALTFLGSTITLFIIVRIIKLGLAPEYANLERWLWYTYYLFYLLIGLFMLWIASATDQPAEKQAPPPWWHALAAISLVLLTIVFTNDLHQLVWKFQVGFIDSSDVNFPTLLNYGIYVFYLLMLLIGTLLLMHKVLNSSYLRYKSLLPLGILVLFFVYIYGYSQNWLAFRQSEVVFNTCLTIDLFVLLGALTGLLTFNKNYEKLFAASSLHMQITDQMGKVIYTSGSTPQTITPDTVIHRQNITAGQVIWYEDVRELNELKRRLHLTSEALQRSQILLAKERQIRGSYLALRMRNQLYDELETVLATKNKDMVSDLKAMQDQAVSRELKEASVHHLNILACFLKKKCVMLLHGKAENFISIKDLTAAFTESCHYALQAGLATALRTEVSMANCSTMRAMFLYDCFEEALETALSKQATDLLVQLTEKPDKSLTLICYVGGDTEKLLEAFLELVQSSTVLRTKNGSKVEVKNLDDAITLSVSI